MDNKEKIEFFKEWIDEIDDYIKRLEDEIANLSIPKNKTLWQIDQKCKMYNSNEQFKKWFSEEIIHMNGIKEEIEEEIPFIIEELDVFHLLKTKVEEKLNEYKQS